MEDHKKVVFNKYGFYQLKEIPSQSELNEYYQKKYYQENNSTYLHNYSSEELRYILNKIEQKALLINQMMKPMSKSPSLLDVGCGEGFTLSYFHNQGWKVKGIDFSSYGCKHHNPQMLENFTEGDVYALLNKIIESGEKFDCIWLDNVLEHVIDPENLLKRIFEISHSGTVLVVEVPNDFSTLQKKLLETGAINKEFWVVSPDHISYFNRSGLENLAQHCGWISKDGLADFPIDFNLANPFANYVMQKETGKGAHAQRIFIDNMMHDISPELTNQFYKSLAQMGLGRQISVFLMPNKF
jgi:2-polyprenyl-3-methyl-5-hydroxy-6-metoxy-1,4-benzoquinol methylase